MFSSEQRDSSKRSARWHARRFLSLRAHVAAADARRDVLFSEELASLRAEAAQGARRAAEGIAAEAAEALRARLYAEERASSRIQAATGACLATEQAARGMVIGTHPRPYGGHPRGMAAAAAVLDVRSARVSLPDVNETGQPAPGPPKQFASFCGVMFSTLAFLFYQVPGLL